MLQVSQDKAWQEPAAEGWQPLPPEPQAVDGSGPVELVLGEVGVAVTGVVPSQPASLTAGEEPGAEERPTPAAAGGPPAREHVPADLPTRAMDQQAAAGAGREEGAAAAGLGGAAAKQQAAAVDPQGAMAAQQQQQQQGAAGKAVPAAADVQPAKPAGASKPEPVLESAPVPAEAQAPVGAASGPAVGLLDAFLTG